MIWVETSSLPEGRTAPVRPAEIEDLVQRLAHAEKECEALYKLWLKERRANTAMRHALVKVQGLLIEKPSDPYKSVDDLISNLRKVALKRRDRTQ